MAVNTKMLFEHYRGEDVVLSFTMAPVQNVTGWTIKLYLKTDAEASGDPLLTITATITDGSAGTFSVTLTSAQTLALLAGKRYRFDVWREGTGVQTLLFAGNLDILGQVRFAPPAP